MRIKLLGTAAGGGFPQWNCKCSNCDGIRRGTLRGSRRREFCAAIAKDDGPSFLIDSPADVREQIESFPSFLSVTNVRSSGIQGILLTGADLDQSLGLLTLREGPPMTVHASDAARQGLTAGLRIAAILDCYSGIEWRSPPNELLPLVCRDGSTSGLLYSAFTVPCHPSRYLKGHENQIADARVGYRIVDEETGGRLVIVPGIAQLDRTVSELFEDCDVLLLDGTFWSDDELQRTGTGSGGQSAAAMGHLPIGGPGGSLAKLNNPSPPRRIYVHINNTNPILSEESAEYAEVCSAGFEVGTDGLEFSL